MDSVFKVSNEQKSFYKTDFYSNIKKRKDTLQNKLLEMNQDSWYQTLPITKVEKETEVDELVDFLQKYQSKENAGFELDEDSTRVQLAGKRGITICDFICVEYFRLYAVSVDRTQIQRFSYFELYYDKYVVSCIADANIMKKNLSFPAVHLESDDWAQAKQQMQLWGQYLLPEIEELPIPKATFPEGINERIRWGCAADCDDSESQPLCPDAGNPLWEVATYIRLIQFLPILPRAAVPWYYLNLVCENKTDRNVFAEKLKAFLEEHFQEDPVIDGEVRLLQKLFLAKMTDKESYRAVPYVLVLEKQKDIDQLCDKFTEIDGAVKKRKNHPFKDSIPICISDHQILDSAVLNIMVPDVQKMSWDSKRFVMLTSSSDAIFRTYHMLKDKKSTRSWMKVVRKEMQHMIGEYCAVKGIGISLLSDLTKYQPKMLELMTWFILLWHGVGSEDSASGSEKIFVVSLIEDLIQQQNILNNIVDVLMNHFKKAFDGLPDGRPLADLVDKKYVPEEMVFRTEVKEDSLLCFYPDYFTEWLKEHDLNVRQDDVLECLKARGLLTTDSDKPFLRGIKLKKRDPHLGKGNDVSVNHIAIKME